jgi:hypothetical protein
MGAGTAASAASSKCQSSGGKLLLFSQSTSFIFRALLFNSANVTSPVTAVAGYSDAAVEGTFVDPYGSVHFIPYHI